MIIQRIKDFLRIGYLGVARSSGWQSLSKEIIKLVGECEACGSKKRLESHHCVPFHEDPSKELDRKNIIVLCRICHLLIGHLNSWKSFNKDVRQDADTLLNKINNRPN